MREALWLELLAQGKVTKRERTGFRKGWNAAVVATLSAVGGLVNLQITSREPLELGRLEEGSDAKV